ncbi:MAG: hypothetical protein MJK18_11465, partial [Bdellovibrionales bacterium]|nr:hypothetical protein [Bdellovibrionales bacterium]
MLKDFLSLSKVFFYTYRWMVSSFVLLIALGLIFFNASTVPESSMGAGNGSDWLYIAGIMLLAIGGVSMIGLPIANFSKAT